MPEIDPRLVALVVGAVVVLGVGFWAVKHFFFTVPSLSSVKPSPVEMGQGVTLTGARFSRDPADNKVWFGNMAVVPTGGDGDTLQVRVPPLAAAGAVLVSVETSVGRSRSVSLSVLAPLRVASVDPEGALPGEEVTLNGSGFAEGMTVTVGGRPATVAKAEAHTARFQMPKLEGAAGRQQAVVATVSGRSSSPVYMYVGHLPLVGSLEPAKGVAGDLVRVKGAGFGAAPAVTFDGAPALVVTGSPNELVVVVPPSSRAQAEASLPVVVQAGGRGSEALSFTQLRLVEGAWVPRFLAGAVGEGGAAGQATVGTELGPVLLLSWKGDSRSVGERALAVAKDLNGAVDRARVGQTIGFEAREDPQVCVGLAGAPDTLVTVYPQDAAAFETPPGYASRGAPPQPIALARHWAALLNDTVAIGTSGAKPKATADMGPPAAPTFAQLRTVLPWQYGLGVPSERVLAVNADLKKKLRESAFRVP
jgi:hypothetical protein